MNPVAVLLANRYYNSAAKVSQAYSRGEEFTVQGFFRNKIVTIDDFDGELVELRFDVGNKRYVHIVGK